MISKELASRFKPILLETIAPNHSAFVSVHLITDNILLAYEVTHYMENKRIGSVGYVALKLDMGKAYDRVEWQFFEGMIRKMGFAISWVATIMKCAQQ